MKHRIDPKIDCVFKALLGSLENRNLLENFLNAILSGELRAPIDHVDILNPYNEKEFLDDKLSIVDVKASDGDGRIFQIEIQMVSYRHLLSRILYTWTDIYSQQLQSGAEYHKLRPTYSIWLLAEDSIPEDDDYLHAFKMRDAKGRALSDHGGIWLLELDKFGSQTAENDHQRWLLFFKQGEQLDDDALPDWMTTPEMRQAMTTLRQFSEKEINYHAYQSRQNFLREQRTIQWELNAAQQEKQQALLREQAAVQREETARQRELEAKQREREAQQREREAKQQELEAKQRAREALLREHDAKQREQAALSANEAALAEIERLKAQLSAK